MEIPASWHVFTTSVTSLYDSGASSITSFGEATRMEIPLPESRCRCGLRLSPVPVQMGAGTSPVPVQMWEG